MAWFKRKPNILASNIREIDFYNEHSNASVSAEDLFDIAYSPLDDLIAHNEAEFLGTNGKRSRARRRVSVSYGDVGQVSNDLAQHARSGINKATEGLIAKIHFDQGGVVTMAVEPRTNYHPSLLKRPNILFLENPDYRERLVFREARDYDSNGVLKKIARAKFRDHLNFDHGEQIGRSKLDHSEISHRDVVIIPESALVLALEQAVRDNEEIMRITPTVKFVGLRDRTAWYLRDFLPSVRDTPLDMVHASAYLATLHGLGLMDGLDLDSSEYSVEGRFTVNIDPDFFCYTQNRNIINDRGLSDARCAFQEIAPHAFDYELLKKHRNRILHMVDNNLAGKSILDYIPSCLSDSVVLHEKGVEDIEQRIS